MKKKLLILVLAVLGCQTMKAADGDTFTSNTTEGVTMSFKVISEAQKKCQVKSASSSYGSASINKGTTGTVTVPSEVNGYSVTVIGKYAFYGCTELSQINLPNSITEIAEESFKGCTNLASITIPQDVTTIGLYAFLRCSSLLSITIPANVTYISNTICAECSSLESITVEEGNTVFDSRNNCNGIIRTATNTLFQGCKNTIIPESIVRIDQAFDGCVGLTSIVIPASVTSMIDAFVGCDNLTTVTALANEPCGTPNFSNKANATLYVPKGCVPAYEASYQWSGFKETKEITTSDDITMSANEIATYSSTHDLDFTDVSGLKAYIASGFSPSTGDLLLTRVFKVPAGEGVLLKGAADNYEVPYTLTDMVYSNLLKGVTTETEISPTDGAYTNFILANGSHGIGFYPLASTGNISANKAYLQIKTADVSTARPLNIIFEDESTAVNKIVDKEEIMNEDCYNLAGMRVANPTKGLYIVNGKKYVIR